MKVAIVGSGFGGLGMAAALKRAGENDFVLFERAANVGGTWRDNCYPGAACDVESPLYSFSFFPNPRWSRMFSPQEEILAYLKMCVDKLGLAPHLRLGVGLDSARYDAGSGEWLLQASDGSTHRARALVAACGGLARPALPDIAGLDRFKGAMFHSARWDKKAKLAAKRVGVIGTGASAIQIVPELAKVASELLVFQRTPPWILPKADRPFSDEEKTRFERSPLRQRLLRARLYWQHELYAVGITQVPALMSLATRLVERHLEKKIQDPVLREKVMPRYVLGCKRILISNDYYPALAQPNVQVITAGIANIEARGVATKDGAHHALDALILATGFHAADAIAPFAIEGRDGRSLDDAWQGGAEAYLGTSINGFPNFFMIIGPNTGLGHSSMILQIESQVRYIMGAIKTLADHRSVEVRKDTQEQFNTALHARFPRTVWNSGCVSWYQTKDGKNTTLWPGFTFDFRWKTRRFDRRNYEIT